MHLILCDSLSSTFCFLSPVLRVSCSPPVRLTPVVSSCVAPLTDCYCWIFGALKMTIVPCQSHSCGILSLAFFFLICVLPVFISRSQSITFSNRDVCHLPLTWIDPNAACPVPLIWINLGTVSLLLLTSWTNLSRVVFLLPSTWINLGAVCLHPSTWINLSAVCLLPLTCIDLCAVSLIKIGHWCHTYCVYCCLIFLCFAASLSD
jgi:hypothetical protein